MGLHYKSDMGLIAHLRAPNGRLLEIGEVNVSREQRSVDFISEFVQLFTIGTPLQIVLLKDDTEVQRFEGEVYLSSSNLLRLVGVADKIFPAARQVCLFPVAIRGEVKGASQKRPEPGREGLFKNLLSRQRASSGRFDVNIHHISLRELQFTSDRVLEPGQRIELALPDYGIAGLRLDITRVYEFGPGQTNYHCRIHEPEMPAKKQLDALLGDICDAQLKML